jgi:hypothetical protein
MPFNKQSELKTKQFESQNVKERDRAIAERTTAALRNYSIRDAGRRTGYHPETVRRYLLGKSKMPADFIGQLCRSCDELDPYTLIGLSTPKPTDQIRYAATHLLIDELGHRIRMIEESTITSLVTQCKSPRMTCSS